MTYHSKRSKFGFTLIELLVVISIIGILAAVGMVSYSAAGKGARDARRKSDLETIRQALVMYRSEFGCYPSTGAVNGANGILGILAAKHYLTEPLPRDPKSPGQEYAYLPGTGHASCTDPDHQNGKSSFTLQATLEKPAGAIYPLSGPQ